VDISSSQTRSVTNAEIEKYRQDRLQSEREYRENYERLGMPSPEELDRRRDLERLETSRLSDKLRLARIEFEKLKAEQLALDIQVAANDSKLLVDGFGQTESFGFYYVNRRRVRPHYSRHKRQTGYFAAGQFWPLPTRTIQPTSRWLSK
jgi:hypothetical protein